MRQPHLFSCAFAFVLAAAGATHAAPRADVLPFRATETTLPNGLKVIVVPTGFPNIVSLHIPVQVGARNEVEPGKTGFAHFFEHMMFRGTKAYPPERYQALLTQMGARQNAYTTPDFTNYHTTFAKEDLEQMLELEADRFQRLDYSEEGFKTESRAVLGEYNKNSANPLRKLNEVQAEAAFTTHTYRHTTMGFLKDIEDMPNQQAYSREFFDRYYRPENTTLIIAGDVEARRALALVRKYWGGWRRGSHVSKIPAEPAPQGPRYAHVSWETSTLPWVTVAFHGPAFAARDRGYAAIELLMDLYFGDASELHKELVERTQKVDQLWYDGPGSHDPGLLTVGARVKRPEDAVAVRDAIIRTAACLRAEPVDAQRLADAKSNARNALVRRLDNTETIAGLLARYVRYERRFATLNELYRTVDEVTPADLSAAAERTFTDARMVVTTLSREPMPEGMKQLPTLASFAPAPSGAALELLIARSEVPLVDVKLLFTTGSADDPPGKEGLAQLAASMIADAGSARLRTEEIIAALYPMAGSFVAQVDREMTTFTAIAPSDAWAKFADVVFPMLVTPGFREEDFKRLRDAQKNSLVVDLRTSNEEELGKERLQSLVFRGTPYGHPTLGTVAGLESITLEDVKAFVRERYVRARLSAGAAGKITDDVAARVRAELGKLPEGRAGVKRALAVRPTPGLKVELVEKDTRATAISFGHPIEVRRGHPDFLALWLARAWLGEHRSSMARLYERLREVRGLNYGDYAYIEAFPRGMFQFFPDPNLGRAQQLFEVWIRPVAPENAHMALRIALVELERLVKEGLTQEDFERTRQYLMKNVYVMTARQDQALGYALDSAWYGIPEFTRYAREGLAKLTVADVNEAVRRHLRPRDVQIVMITKDTKTLRDALVSDAPSPIKYDAEKPAALLAEDAHIGATKLALDPKNVVVTPVEHVFAK